jgi:hypothetical protein
MARERGDVVSDPMNPEAIIERTTIRPFAGPETVRTLAKAGWHLVHVSHEVSEETGLNEGRRDDMRVVVWDKDMVLQRTYLTSETIIRYLPDPELMLKARVADLWRDVAMNLGRVLGVIE